MARNKYPEETVQRILDVATTLFLEKGYEQTTIQNIINTLGDLSKGAIYHHFKSKEEIIIAVMDRMFHDSDVMYEKIKMSKGLTGFEKLKALFSFSIGNSNQEQIVKTLPNLLKNPKFLALQLDSTMNELASDLIGPIILEGVADGSIQTQYPKELAEVISLLSNIWINPMIFHCSAEELYRKTLFFKQILKGLNVDILDDEIMTKLEKLGNTMMESNLPK